MAEMIGLAASAAGGGLFGLAGTALGRVVSYFERRQNQAHEARRWQHEVHLLELQQQAAAAKAEADLSRAEIAGSWRGLDASLRAEAAIGASYQWVDAIRALTRPTLTVLLWLITVSIWFSADAADQGAITETATFAATAATLWWFGDRGARGTRGGSG